MYVIGLTVKITRKKQLTMPKLKNNPLIHFNLNGTDVLKECLEYLKKIVFYGSYILPITRRDLTYNGGMIHEPN